MSDYETESQEALTQESEEENGKPEVEEDNLDDDVAKAFLENGMPIPGTKDELEEETKVPAKLEEDKEPEEQPTKPVETTKEAKKSDKPTPIAPPQSWTKERQERFLAYPEEVKQAIADDWKHNQKHFTQVTEKASKLIKEAESYAQQHRSIEQAYNYKPEGGVSIREKCERAGIDVDKYFVALASADRALDQNPEQVLEQLANQYGVKEKLLQKWSGKEEAKPTADPRLERELAEVKQRLAQYEGERTKEAQTYEQSARTQALQAFNASFSKLSEETDSFGNFKRPELFNASFKQRFNVQLQAIAQTDPELGMIEAMEKAYSATLAANPQLKISNPSRVESVRRAASSTPGSRSAYPSRGSKAVPGNLDMDDAVASAISEWRNR